ALAPTAPEHIKAEAKIASDAAKDFPIEALGSGSDFSVFLDHLGVPALNIGFAEEGRSGGVYHSRYDTFEHHSRFVDPGFIYDALLAKTSGRLVERVADSDLPVQNAGGLANAISEYLEQVKKLADEEREQAEAQAGLLHDRAFQLAADPTKSSAVPAALDRVPHIEVASLADAVDRLKRSAKAYDDALANNGSHLSCTELERVQVLILRFHPTPPPALRLPPTPPNNNLL